MTTNATDISTRRERRSTAPHLPPIARDPLDDAREALAAFTAWQAGDSDASRTEVSESLAAALRALLPMLARPQRRQLAAWQRLPLEQARCYLDQLATLPRDGETDAARQLGRLEVHTAKVIDLVDALVQPW